MRSSLSDTHEPMVPLARICSVLVMHTLPVDRSRVSMKNRVGILIPNKQYFEETQR